MSGHYKHQPAAAGFLLLDNALSPRFSRGMSIYSGIPLATLQSRLTEAQDALHALLTGSLTASVSTGDKRITFHQTEIPALRTYIADLLRAISIASGSAPASRAPAVATWTR